MKILVVDDNASLARGLKTFLTQESHEAETAQNVHQALTMIAGSSYDLVITDLRLPDGEGLQIIEKIRSNQNVMQPEIILMTAFGSVESAAEAMRLGVTDYLTKPVSMEEFSFRISRIVEFRRLHCQKQKLLIQCENLKHDAGLDLKIEDMIGNGPKMAEVKKQILKVAPYPSTVLVTGETGAGKEMVAKALHQFSNHSAGPFIRVNCASIPETLFESELFGHEKGAFTDARQRRIGSFEAADGGTLFLDEVGEIPLGMQAKLLRVLQEKEITRLGSSTPVKVDVRIVAATNRNLDNMVKQGAFREDLLYRLSVFNINVPPLRERLEDFAALSNQLIEKISSELGRPGMKLSADYVEMLKNQSWPGNIRQLKNYLERDAVMSDGLMICNIKEPVRKQPQNDLEADLNDSAGLVDAIEKLEKKLILQALEKSSGIKSRAAEILKIPRTQLLYRLKRLGLESDDS